MKKDPGTIALIFSTILVIILNISNLIDYLSTGDKGGTFSNICFLLGMVCIVLAWIQYFIARKKNSK
jgi:hypothetical protein